MNSNSKCTNILTRENVIIEIESKIASGN